MGAISTMSAGVTVAEARQDRHGGITCHRTGVVGAALDLVPWVAIAAAIPVANRLDDTDAAPELAHLQQRAAEGILVAMLGFLCVRDRYSGSTGLIGKGTDKRAGLTGDPVDPTGVCYLAEVLLEIGLVDGNERRPDFVGGKQVAKAIEAGVPLRQHLVDAGSVLDLVLDLPVLLAPVEVEDGAPRRRMLVVADVVSLQQMPVIEIDKLDEVPPIEEMLIDPGPAPLEYRTILRRRRPCRRHALPSSLPPRARRDRIR